MRLILEGGGVRAAYSSGVCAGLEAAGVRPSAVVGSSSGSMNAAFFAAGRAEVLCDLWRDMVPGSRFISYRRLLTPWGKPGLDVDGMIDDIIDGGGLLDPHAATSSEIALYIVATNVATEMAHVQRPSADNLFEWLRASHAIPVGYNRIIEIEGQRFVDGGVAAPVPFDVPLEEEHAGPTVVILTRPMDTHKPPPSWWQRGFLRAIVPEDVRRVSFTQHELHNSTMTRLTEANDGRNVIVVDPPAEMDLKRVTRDPRRIEKGISLGREVGARLAETLRSSKLI